MHAPAAGASVVGSAVHLNGFDASKFNSENLAAFWPVWQAQPCNDLYGETYPFQRQDHLRGRTELFGLQFFSIGLSSKQSQVTYHLHLTPDKVRQFAAYVLANDRFLPEVESRPTSP
jgi:hypothetical protein